METSNGQTSIDGRTPYGLHGSLNQCSVKTKSLLTTEVVFLCFS